MNPVRLMDDPLGDEVSAPSFSWDHIIDRNVREIPWYMQLNERPEETLHLWGFVPVEGQTRTYVRKEEGLALYIELTKNGQIGRPRVSMGHAHAGQLSWYSWGMSKEMYIALSHGLDNHLFLWDNIGMLEENHA